jgi:hypothetical protein
MSKCLPRRTSRTTTTPGRTLSRRSAARSSIVRRRGRSRNSRASRRFCFRRGGGEGVGHVTRFSRTGRIRPTTWLAACSGRSPPAHLTVRGSRDDSPGRFCSCSRERRSCRLFPVLKYYSGFVFFFT